MKIYCENTECEKKDCIYLYNYLNLDVKKISFSEWGVVDARSCSLSEYELYRKKENEE